MVLSDPCWWLGSLPGPHPFLATARVGGMLVSPPPEAWVVTTDEDFWCRCGCTGPTYTLPSIPLGPGVRTVRQLEMG